MGSEQSLLIDEDGNLSTENGKIVSFKSTPTDPPLISNCNGDNFCMNFDSLNSTPGNIIFSCPNAKCSGGSCDCGSECKMSSTGTCCGGTVEGVHWKRNFKGEIVCLDVKHTQAPTPVPTPVPTSAPTLVPTLVPTLAPISTQCNISDKTLEFNGGKIVIKGQQICDWINE